MVKASGISKGSGHTLPLVKGPETYTGNEQIQAVRVRQHSLDFFFSR